METPVRLWSTEDEGELVLDNDPKARLLAYGEGDEVSESDEAAAKKAINAPSEKKAAAPVNKERAASGNKAAKKS